MQKHLCSPVCMSHSSTPKLNVSDACTSGKRSSYIKTACSSADVSEQCAMGSAGMFYCRSLSALQAAMSMSQHLNKIKATGRSAVHLLACKS